MNSLETVVGIGSSDSKPRVGQGPVTVQAGITNVQSST